MPMSAPRQFEGFCVALEVGLYRDGPKFSKSGFAALRAVEQKLT
jgi:hypothetical protein